MANPSNLQVTPCSALADEGTELNFRGLYLYHTFKGKSPNQVNLVSSLNANNWEVKDGLGPNAKVVARAQGLHIHVGPSLPWHNSFSLVFEDERRNPLSVIIAIELNSQRATSSQIKSRWIVKGDIIELTIHGFCPKLKGSRIIPVKTNRNSCL
ncbi:hypothetical protein EJB05_14293, partial [Eragrostis curvula]